jgi:hypothetical protein
MVVAGHKQGDLMIVPFTDHPDREYVFTGAVIIQNADPKF